MKAIPYITTPIYYVNASPHIGHLYSSLIADATQRWHRIRHRGVLIKFATGTDEHGTKIQQAAEINRTSLPTYCSAISDQYKELANTFNIQYTNFIRTTSDVHKKTVQRFWNQLSQKGVIYKSKYEGWYCVSDESFLSEFQLKEKMLKNGERVLISSESGHYVEWTEEPNYMFKLSSFGDDLEYWLTKNEKSVQPTKFRRILQDLLKTEGTLSDVSVSRPSSRVHWGISVPSDETQTIYVWLDALVNYLTAAGYSQIPDIMFHKVWPPDLQVIGKDILKFHGIYWPAFLMAAGLEPPRTILCHSHWTVNGEKMSKSRKNVINPMQRLDTYTPDGLRYFLLREGVSHSDGNYVDSRVVNILNSELADTLGNLLSRCCGNALNTFQVFPKFRKEGFSKIASLDVSRRLIEKLEALPGVCEQHYADYNFYKVADTVMATLRTGNLFFETLKPWELKKDFSKHEDLAAVLHLAMETLRFVGILLQPLAPTIATRLLDKLGIPEQERFFDNLTYSWEKVQTEERKLSPEKLILFKRMDNHKIEIQK